MFSLSTGDPVAIPLKQLWDGLGRTDDSIHIFDMVNHDILMNRVARRVRDKGILRLIGKYLRAGVVVNSRLNQTSKGVPQGGPLSPLLSNILLDDLDKELEKRGHRFARYADDRAPRRRARRWNML